MGSTIGALATAALGLVLGAGAAYAGLGTAPAAGNLPIHAMVALAGALLAVAGLLLLVRGK